MALGTVRRNVRFFAWENVLEQDDFDLAQGMADVAALMDDWKVDAFDMTTGAIIDREPVAGAPACLRFFRLREGDDLPHKMDIARMTSPVDVLDGEAITDWTHVVIWPDGYAAHDPHRDAPSLVRLAVYLRDTVAQRVRFLPLFDRDLLDQLRELDELRAVELRLAKPDALQDLEDRKLGIFAGIFNMAREAESANIATTISVGRSRTKHLNPEVKDDVVALAEAANDYLDQLVVRGVRDGRAVRIDLLNQRIEGHRDVRRAAPNVRQPNTNDMYDSIIALRRQYDETDVLSGAARGRLT